MKQIDLTQLTPAPWVADNLNWRNEESPFDRYVHGDRYEDEDGTICSTSVAVVLGNATSVAIQDSNAEFITLARNAFDVMLRRGWGVRMFSHNKSGGQQWSVENIYGDGFWFPHHDKSHNIKSQFWPDPFTALVEADRWYSDIMIPVEAKKA